MKKLISSLLCILAPSSLALSSGDNIPDVSAKNQSGKTIRLRDYKGQYMLVYFYPKDETPGCTKEACMLRDEYSKFRALNTVVFGISRQDEKSHQEFISKHKLPFDLLVDTDGSLGKAFGVPSIPIVGFSKRQSILIGPDGKVLEFYKDVDPIRHADQVLADIKRHSGK